MTTPERKLAGVEPMAVEVTNGTIDPAHYGPIGDAARHIASYCEGRARVHVYTAAFDTLIAWNNRATPPAQTAVVEAWQDIESAPKDTYILLCGYLDGHHDPRIKLGYFWTEEDRWSIDGASWKPRFWQPLPKPPTLSLATGERS